MIGTLIIVTLIQCDIAFIIRYFTGKLETFD